MAPLPTINTNIAYLLWRGNFHFPQEGNNLTMLVLTDPKLELISWRNSLGTEIADCAKMNQELNLENKIKSLLCGI